jgi:cysteine synthase A
MFNKNSTVFQQMCRLIGSTPLSKISFQYYGEERFVYVKHENYNLTGSVKDRMALHILYNAYLSGQIGPNSVVVEATSGNTGISFAAICRALGHPVRIYMPDWMSKERVNLIKSFGATIVLVSKEEGGFKGAIQQAIEYGKQNPDAFLPSQFSNQKNCEAHYLTTAPEIWHQLKFLGVTPDAFVAGVGTGGTIMGIGKYLKEQNPSIKIHALEPSNSPTLRTGCKAGKHRIEGISDEFVPDLIQFDKLDEIIDVDDGDAILMAQKIAYSLGMGVGISSGANFLGALKAQMMLGKEAVVATMFPDDNKKYLSTDLMHEEPIKPEYITPYITDLRVETVTDIRDLPAQLLYSICNFPSPGGCEK